MRKPLILLLLLASLRLCAQNEVDTLAKDNVSIPLPTVSVNVGFNYAFADVELGSVSPFRQLGYQLTITQRVAKFLNASFELYTGSVYGEEQRGLTNLNYRTSIVSPRIGIEYNFYPLLKPDSKGRQLIRPYIGFGVGLVYFRSKGDLQDESGNGYNYWSDGLIYAEQEGTVNQSEATLLERDFEYETDLRDANLDNFGKYSQTAFSLPINAGIRFQISKNVGVNAAFAYVLNFTDLIDNSSSESVGTRQGSSNFDNHLFGSIGLSVFLGRTKPSAKPVKPRFEEQIATEESAENPEEIKVEEANQKWDKLAQITEQLVEASETMKSIADSSEASLKGQSKELTTIADKDLSSKKDFRAAKKESIELLENTITVLNQTTNDLDDVSGAVNDITVNLEVEEMESDFENTSRIRATVEETVPTMESLKAKIASAKNAAELKSILNISSSNLRHTSGILSEESVEINRSMAEARKSVAITRAEKLLEDSQQETISIDALEQELAELREQGALSQSEYEELNKAVTDSKAQAAKSVANSTESTEQEYDKLESASLTLKQVITAITNTNNTAEKNLALHSNELTLISEKQLDSKQDFKQAKEEALKILNQATEDLKEVDESIVEASTKIDEIESEFVSVLPENNAVSTDKITSAVSNTTALIESSKDRIKSAKNREELKSIINIASSNLSRTGNTISKESGSITQEVDDLRKTIILNEVEATLANADDSTEKKVSVNSKSQETIQTQIDQLLSDNLIDQVEYAQIKEELEEKTVVSNELVTGATEASNSSNLEQTVPRTLTSYSKSVAALDELNQKADMEISVQQNELDRLAAEEIQKGVSLQEVNEQTATVLDETIKQLKQSSALAVEAKNELESAQSIGNKDQAVAANSEFTEVENSIQEAISELKDLKLNAQSSKDISTTEMSLKSASKIVADVSENVSSKATSLTDKVNAERKSYTINQLESVSADMENGSQNTEVLASVSNLLENELEALKKEGIVDNVEYEQAKRSISEPSETAMDIEKNTEVSSGRNTKSGFDIESIEESQPKETGDFSWADLNKNNWISPDEVLHFIDLLFEGDAVRTVEDIQELIDYYFDQE